MNRRLLLATFAALLFSTFAWAQADQKALRLALLPDENATGLIQNAQPLKSYLEKRLGRDIELIVTTDYSSMIEATRFGRVDIAYFGPFSYVLARSRADIEPFAVGMSRGSPTYTSVIVVQADSPIRELNDLKGKTFAYGDQASTSSHLVPRAYLLEKGLDADEDYKKVFLGAHDAVARAVIAGQAQAGALSKAIFDSLVATGKLDGSKLRILAETAPIPNYPIVMQAKLAPALKTKIREAFLEMTDPEVLKSFRAEGFVATSDSAYDVLRNTAKILKLDLGKMQ